MSFVPSWLTPVLDWLVITADGVERGPRRARIHARLVSADLLSAAAPSASPRRDELRRVAARRRHAVPRACPLRLRPTRSQRLVGGTRIAASCSFDYLDQHELAWTAEQEPALRAVSRPLPQTVVRAAWNYGLRWACCRSADPRGFHRHRRHRSNARLRRRAARRAPQYDVAFLGRPNDTRVLVDGEVRKVDQRFEWLAELKRDASDLTFWGGFVGRRATDRRPTQAASTATSRTCITAPGKVSFSAVLPRDAHEPRAARPRRQRPVDLPPLRMPVRRRRRGDDRLPPARHARSAAAGGVVHVPDGAAVAPTSAKRWS